MKILKHFYNENCYNFINKNTCEKYMTHINSYNCLFNCKYFKDKFYDNDEKTLIIICNHDIDLKLYYLEKYL